MYSFYVFLSKFFPTSTLKPTDEYNNNEIEYIHCALEWYYDKILNEWY